MTRTTAAIARSLGAAVALLLLCACGGTDDPADAGEAGKNDETGETGETSDETGETGETSDETTTTSVPDPDPAGVPEECAAQFPAATRTPDLDRITRLVEEFPPPPVEATLCVTRQTSTHQVAKYVTDASPEEVLDAYEPLLADLFFSRHEAGDGADVPSLIGTPDDILTQVTAYDGWFEIGVSLA